MKDLWSAFIARLVYLLTPKPPVPQPAPVIKAPEPPLTHGFCYCSHHRCSHIEGKYKCGAAFKPHSEHNDTDGWLYCGCQFYMPKRDDPPDPQPETPSPAELERMFNA